MCVCSSQAPDLSFSCFVVVCCCVVVLFLFSRSATSDSLQPHGLQHARSPCPSLSPQVCSNSCPLSQWSHPTTSSSVIPFSYSQSYQRQDLFQWIGSSHQVDKVLDLQLRHQSFQWIFNSLGILIPLGLTGLISLQSKGLARVFSSTTIRKHQFFGAQFSLWSNSHIPTWLLEKP